VMSPPRVLAFIMAGGRGERLEPLTRERSKPAVPFGGRYRIIDFVLSNFVNSGILSLYVLVQYKSQSLIEHLRLGWRSGGLSADHFVTVVPPQMRMGEMWYRGTADAVLQNLNLVDDFAPDLVAIFGADHIYRMAVNQMVSFHIARAAQVTVAGLPVPVEQATGFGVIGVGRDGRIVSFEEKPASPRAIPDRPTHAFASMGNYLFDRDTLLDTLLEDAQRPTDHDFGGTIIPGLLPQARVFAYDFQANEVPGLKPYEERGYWRDIGTIESYWQAHMDLLGEAPRLDLDNPAWPILASRYHGPAARILGGSFENAQIGEGSLVRHATVRRSLLGRGVRVDEGCVVEDSIVMDFSELGKGTRLRRVIVDRFNRLERGTVIGENADEDARGYYVDRSGITVVPRGGRVHAPPFDGI
ncbi:MAG: glucose-1-phosphate adenylyltransferase, partial [Candidatus Rokuibacteriota bacterium]